MVTATESRDNGKDNLDEKPCKDRLRDGISLTKDNIIKEKLKRRDKSGNDDSKGKLGRSSRNQDSCGIIDDLAASGKSRATNQ